MKLKVSVIGLTLAILLVVLMSPFYMAGVAEAAPEQGFPSSLETVNAYFSMAHTTLADGAEIDAHVINGPPEPPVEYAAERAASVVTSLDRASVVLVDFPAYTWVFGCSAVSGAMIAGYYDRQGYPNMYAGPTEGGVMPLTDTVWETWYDATQTPAIDEPYPNNPLIASHEGVDGQAGKGSIDDYWVSYGSSANDPYITGSWTPHTGGTAIGDYMKTSQSAYGNVDGSTLFYYWNDGEKLECNNMPAYIAGVDGTYGRKLFYEARGYAVTDCYYQQTDNRVSGGFSLADYQAEIDAGHPVMLNLEGHTVVGFGYNGATIYIHDTWDTVLHEMTWGGSYSGMDLAGASVVRPLDLSTLTEKAYLPLLLR